MASPTPAMPPRRHLRSLRSLLHLSHPPPPHPYFTSLPTELLSLIGTFIPSPRDLLSLTRCSHRLQTIFTPHLHALASQPVNNRPALLHAAETRSQSLITLLSKLPSFNINTTSPSALDCTALHIIVSARPTPKQPLEPLIELLISHGASLTARAFAGATVLHQAVRANNKPVVRLLVSHGAAINAQDDLGWTPLFLAVKNARYGMSRLLLDLGASTSIPDNNGRTVLLEAAAERMPRTVGLLLARGALPGHVDNSAKSALHLAVGSGEILRRDVIRMLVGAGADVNAVDGSGRTPLHVAAKRGARKRVRELVKSGADVGARDTMGWTPLHWAADGGCLRVVKVLVESGADRGVRCGAGLTPMEVVERRCFQVGRRSRSWADTLEYLRDGC